MTTTTTTAAKEINHCIHWTRIVWNKVHRKRCDRHLFSSVPFYHFHFLRYKHCAVHIDGICRCYFMLIRACVFVLPEVIVLVWVQQVWKNKNKVHPFVWWFYDQSKYCSRTDSISTLFCDLIIFFSIKFYYFFFVGINFFFSFRRRINHF